MDKTKFLYATAGLDSEGFTLERYDHPMREIIEQHMALLATLPTAEQCFNLAKDAEVKKVLADHFLNGPIADFEGYQMPSEQVCVTPSRTELCGNSHCKDGCYVLAIQNPKGWDEVDGVKLPSVDTWVTPRVPGSFKTCEFTTLSDEALDAAHANWQRDGQRIAQERRRSPR